MYRIVKKEALKPTVILYEIEAPMVAKKAQPGQFIILRVDENGERIPITIHDYDREKGTVTIIVQTVGATTEKLSHKQQGDSLHDFVGPLGKPTETEGKKKVCVVGDYIARVAYGGNAIGQTIKIGSERFTIVGVLEANVSSTTDQEGTDDDMIFVPYTTAQRISKTSASSYGVVLVSDELADEGKNLLVEGIESILHAEDGYFITSLSEMLETMTSMINMVVAILTAIAAISLLVGGIGIMNIMMVSVTERTREIGIRKALGAKERSILALFVTEAATTSALGGLLGIALGYLFSALANRVLPLLVSDMELTVAPSMTSVLVAFGISVGIGVLFGYLPAKRAARLNPIEALRYD